MTKRVLLAGADDACGKRIAGDFAKAGWTVIAINVLGGECPSAAFAAKCDPMSKESIFAAAAEVSKAYDAIDMLVVNYDYRPERVEATIFDKQDFEAMLAGYRYNTLGVLCTINAFMPLLDAGEGKRIGIVTTKDSSNNACYDTADYLNHTTKAPLNMAISQLFNGLRPEEFTFRMYCKDTAAGEDTVGGYAAEYFMRNRSNEPWDPKHTDENRILLRDWMAREIPW